ncbi:hypothetical protein DBY21_00595 [Candidatus Gastranaerophilales bacterium]|nr:MAG: hypothetical protein DBY21_00595 [Candidatus Gastranaerophilales bacterium]
MIEEILDKKSNFDLTSKSAFSKEDDSFTSRSYAALLAKNAIPYSHRKIADNYTIIKRIFKFQAVMSRISNTERALLAKYDFNVLEYTTVKQMYEELALLQKWSSSQDLKLKADADQILEIRSKELKFIDANRYANISNEIYKGYVALEHYFEEISKYKEI